MRANQLEQVGRALWTYCDRYGAFPDALETMLDQGLVPGELLRSRFRDSNSENALDYGYVAGLTRKDPGHWPLVFEGEDFSEDETQLVLFVSGRIASIEKTKRGQLFERFTEEYLRLRGVSPVVRGDR